MPEYFRWNVYRFSHVTLIYIYISSTTVHTIIYKSTKFFVYSASCFALKVHLHLTWATPTHSQNPVGNTELVDVNTAWEAELTYAPETLQTTKVVKIFYAFIVTLRPDLPEFNQWQQDSKFTISTFEDSQSAWWWLRWAFGESCWR